MKIDMKYERNNSSIVISELDDKELEKMRVLLYSIFKYAQFEPKVTNNLLENLGMHNLIGQIGEELLKERELKGLK